MAPEWKEAAIKTKGKVIFAELDATVHTKVAQRYNINGYPTIKVFFPGKRLDEPIDYEGGRTASDLESAAMKYLQKYPIKREIYQLINEKILDEECISKKGICLIGFLPHLIDTKASGRNNYIEILESAAGKDPQYPFYFFWSQAYDQKELEKLFNLGSGYPTVVALSHSKKRYSVMRGAFTADAIADFIRDLMHGYERLYEYEELPKIVEITKWDGSDYKEEL